MSEGAASTKLTLRGQNESARRGQDEPARRPTARSMQGNDSATNLNDADSDLSKYARSVHRARAAFGFSARPG